MIKCPWNWFFNLSTFQGFQAPARTLVKVLFGYGQHGLNLAVPHQRSTPTSRHTACTTTMHAVEFLSIGGISTAANRLFPKQIKTSKTVHILPDLLVPVFHVFNTLMAVRWFQAPRIYMNMRCGWLIKTTKDNKLRAIEIIFHIKVY